MKPIEWTGRRLSDNDLTGEGDPLLLIHLLGGFWHRCWGDKTPMHIGPHRATGAPDRNRVVCACQVAHQEYDEHRRRWYRVTHLTERRLLAVAKTLTQTYDEVFPCP